MTAELMLDPSVFLAERTLSIAISEIEDAQVPVAVPGHFLDLAREPNLFDRVGEFFGGEEEGESGAPAAASRFRGWLPRSEELVVPYRPSDDDLAGAFRGDVAARLEDLPLSDDVKRILLEEWVYLQTKSWIGSRIRAASDRFREAGAEVYGFTLERLEAVVDHARDEIPELLTRENLRPATKWVIGTSLPMAARVTLDAAVPGSGSLTYEVVERLCGIGVGKATDRALARFDP